MHTDTYDFIIFIAISYYTLEFDYINVVESFDFIYLLVRCYIAMVLILKYQFVSIVCGNIKYYLIWYLYWFYGLLDMEFKNKQIR